MSAYPANAGPRATRVLAAGALLLVLGFGGASAQAPRAAVGQLLDISPPQLTYNADGHTAPVRALLFAGDGQLLSGGTDQVIKVWDTPADRPGLNRTIRPPIWRAPRGAVYAMALGPPTTDGARLLAIGGMGMTTKQSVLLLYGFRGQKGNGGDPFQTLPPIAKEADGSEKFQANMGPGWINCLAFDRAGTRLAAGGGGEGEGNGDVVIWDVPAGRVHTRLKGTDGSSVQKLAMSADGRRVWTGGADGALRRWAVVPSRPVPAVAYLAQPAQVAPAPPGARGAIASMALSPDESALAVGREDGTVILYSADDLARAPRYLIAPADAATHGPVDALAFDPVAARPRRLAVARLATHLAPHERPDPSCLVEVRSADDGQLLDAVATVPDLVRTLAYNPSGTMLAYSGGHAQAVYLKDLRRPGAPPAALRGEGSTPRDLAISTDGRRVAYRRQPGAPREGFDLDRRRAVDPIPGDLDPVDPAAPLGGYRLRPTSATDIQIEAPGTGWAGAKLSIDAGFDIRWWSYALLPDPSGHPGVAIGTEGLIHVFAPVPGPGGVLPFRYKLTRQFRAHGGPVVGLAASADGLRLASSGVDQTIRLWPLREARVAARLGATFRARADGRAEVARVQDGGFARAAGLKAGDVVLNFLNRSQDKDLSAEGLARRDDASPPGRIITVQVERAGLVYNAQTSKQDDPTLSLFLTDPGHAGRDANGRPLAATAEREWVLWNPDGFYDTSVTADRRFLGWHRNALKSSPTPEQLFGGTHYFPIRAFEDLLRRPDVVDRLVRGDRRWDALPKQADGVTPLDVVALIDGETPPTVRVAQEPPAAVVAAATPGVTLRVDLGNGPGPQSQLGGARVFVDAREVAAAPAGGWAVGPNRAFVPLAGPGRARITVVARNSAGRTQAASLEVDYRPTAPPPPPAVVAKAPEMLVLTIGAGRFDGPGLAEIRSANLDVRGVPEELFASPLIRRYEGSYPPKVAGPTSPVIRPATRGAAGAGHEEIKAIFQALRARADYGTLDLPEWGPAAPNAGRLGPGDTVVVVVSSYVVDANPTKAGPRARPRLLAADTSLDALEATSVDVDAITEPLAELVTRGCRVVAILDGHHNDTHGQAEAVREWAHRLDEAQVVVCLASYGLPSLPAPARGYSPFFKALTSMAQGKFRGEVDTRRPLTLDIFARELKSLVDDETKSRMEPFINTPTRLGGSATLFAPSSPRESQ